MPYKNEHAARINPPDKYEKIRRENDKFGAGVDCLWGVMKDGKTEVQAIRFDASRFRVDEVRAWLKKHDYTAYVEPATSSKESILSAIQKRHGVDGVVVKTYGADFATCEDGSVVVARITTAALDHDNEVIIPQGVDSTIFEKAGTVFWRHNYDMPVALDMGLKREETALLAKARFIARPKDHAGDFFPDYVKAYVAAAHSVGRSVGVSVGIKATATRSPTRKDLEAYGPGIQKVINRSRLLEWSFTPLACNPEAATLAVGKGLLTKEAVRGLFGIDVEGPNKKSPIGDKIETDPPINKDKKRVYIILGGAENRAQTLAESVEFAVRRAMARRAGKLWF